MMPRLDWEEWRRIMAPALSPESSRTTIDYTDVTASQIISMEPGELDEYFAHLSLLTDTQGKQL